MLLSVAAGRPAAERRAAVPLTLALWNAAVACAATASTSKPAVMATATPTGNPEAWCRWCLVQGRGPWPTLRRDGRTIAAHLGFQLRQLP